MSNTGLDRQAYPNALRYSLPLSFIGRLLSFIVIFCRLSFVVIHVYCLFARFASFLSIAIVGTVNARFCVLDLDNGHQSIVNDDFLLARHQALFSWPYEQK